jgi:hypothetical protein
MKVDHAQGLIISILLIIMTMLFITRHWIMFLVVPIVALITWFSWGIKQDL